MNLYFFIPKLEHCGPMNVVFNNIKELKRLAPNLNIAIIAYRDNLSDNKYKESLRKLGINEFYSLSKYKSPLEKYIFLKKIVRYGDIIHSNGFFPDLYTSLLPKQIVKISTVHSVISKDYLYTYGLFKGTIYGVLHHIVYLNPSFDSIVACSNTVRIHVSKFSIFNRNKILTIHNGVDQSYYHELFNNKKASLKNALLNDFNVNINKETKIFVYSGRLTRLKRVPELITWFLKTSNKNHILLILGDGEEMNLCKDTLKGNNNVIFLGFINEPVTYYQIADYVVSNSALEGFPMGILEGLSCGCKAILSDIPAHNEIIEQLPNRALLLSDFKLMTSKSSLVNKDLSYLSALRMSKEYLSLYSKFFLEKNSTSLENSLLK